MKVLFQQLDERRAEYHRELRRCGLSSARRSRELLDRLEELDWVRDRLPDWRPAPPIPVEQLEIPAC